MKSVVNLVLSFNSNDIKLYYLNVNAYNLFCNPYVSLAFEHISQTRILYNILQCSMEKNYEVYLTDKTIRKFG